MSQPRIATARALVAAAALALAGCATREARLAELDPFPQIRYRCEYEVSGANGVARAERLLDAAGRQVRARADWSASEGADPPAEAWWLRARQGDAIGPRITASWFSESEADLRLESGWLSVQHHVWERSGPRPRPLTLRLELRSNPDVTVWANGAFASPFERSGGPFLLRLDWSEAAALARGAERLHLLAYDERRTVRARAELDPALFARAGVDVEAVFARTRAMAADHLRACQYLEDGGEPEVVVT